MRADFFRRAGGLWVFCYEHGGISHHYHVGVLRRTGDAFAVVTEGLWIPKPKDLQGAITMEKVLRAMGNGDLLEAVHW